MGRVRTQREKLTEKHVNRQTDSCQSGTYTSAHMGSHKQKKSLNLSSDGFHKTNIMRSKVPQYHDLWSA